MATWQNTDSVRGVVQQWSNGTQPTDPPSGYTETTSGTVTLNKALTVAEAAWMAQVDTANIATVNGQTLRQRALAALTTNVTFLGTVAARRANVASGKSAAQTGTTATVTTVAQAQTQIRSMWSTLVQVATALDDLNNDAESITQQNNQVIRLLLNQLDSTTGT